MAENMSTTVRVYDQEAEDASKYVDICSYDECKGLIAICTHDESYILNAEQVRMAIENAMNVTNPRDKSGLFYHSYRKLY